jgi:hypothetical protein
MSEFKIRKPYAPLDQSGGQLSPLVQDASGRTNILDVTDQPTRFSQDPFRTVQRDNPLYMLGRATARGAYAVYSGAKELVLAFVEGDSIDDKL